MMSKTKALCIAVSSATLIMGFSSGAAFANKTVDSPEVEKGTAYLEWKGGYDIDENSDASDAWVQEGNAGYGVTDFWNVEIGAAVEHEGISDGNTDLTTITIDNRFELTEPGEYFVDFGFSVAYGINVNDDDSPDAVEGKLLFAKEIGGFSNLANVIIGHEVGDNSADDTTYGFAWATNYAFTDDFAAGIEWYSDFGNFDGDYDEQSHQVGPGVYGAIGDNLGYEAGALVGVSDSAPDVQLKAVLNYSFSFE